MGATSFSHKIIPILGNTMGEKYNMDQGLNTDYGFVLKPNFFETG
jgi:hypothetical protein